MFYNTGKKIKSVAEIFAIAGILITIFIGAFYVIKGFIITGLILLLGGPILCFLWGLLMYGFGELIDKTCDIKKTLDRLSQEKDDEIENED